MGATRSIGIRSRVRQRATACSNMSGPGGTRRMASDSAKASSLALPASTSISTVVAA
ncbi:MAG: hypothetical protein JWP04_2218 [Belnapia sp.]|nr:hypothetical protein [Belnapia sp.]